MKNATTKNNDLAQRKAITSTFLLRTVPLFSGLPEEILQQIAPSAERISYPRNTKIIVAGEKTSCLYVVVSGSVKICSHTKDGRENILSTLGSREFFGEMALIDDQPRSADVVTLEAVEVLKIDRTDLLQCMRNNFNVSMEIIISLTKRLRNADRKIVSLALLNVEDRVKSLLYDLSTIELNGQRVIKSRLSRQSMARMVGASREMVSRVMRDLETTGFINKENKYYVLTTKEISEINE